MNKFKVLKILLPPAAILLAAAAVIRFQGTGPDGNNADSPEDVLQEALGGDPVPVPESEPAENSEPDVRADPRPEGTEDKAAVQMPELTAFDFPVNDLPLHDLHAVPGQKVRFRIYHPETVNPVWEYYDMESRAWMPAAGDCVGEETDPQGNVIHYADFETPEEQPELMIRCLYEQADTGEQIPETAFLKALPQEIRQLALASEGITAEAGSCLASHDITVEVTYADGTTDIMDGLYNLFFMDTETDTGSSEFVSADGILTEKKEQTILNHFRQYRLTKPGEETVTLAYMPDTESPQLRLSGTITGTDEEPPEVSGVDILAREDSGGETSMTVLINAEDNVTPYPLLQYAVLQKEDREAAGDDTEIAEEDWTDSPRITVTLQENSAWFFCCRDQAGNTAIYRYHEDEDPPADPETIAEGPGEPQETGGDTHAPVIRNIYVEAE